MKANEAGNISLLYGFLGCAMGIFCLAGPLIAINMLSTFPKEPQLEKMAIYLTALQSVWSIYMPIAIAIGLLYILSGFLIKKGKKAGIHLGVVSALLNLIWFVGYTISLYINVIPVFPHIFHPGLFAGAVIFAGIILCSYPIYYLINFNKIDISSKTLFGQQ